MFSTHEIALMVFGLAAFGVVGLPKVLAKRPLSFPIIYVVGGAVLFSLPLGLPAPDPIEHREIAEFLTEIGVVTALLGAGLAINKAPGTRSWALTWRLLGFTMPITIAAVAVLGWWALGLTPAAALLLGGVLAPTDPVLASDVQLPGPGVEGENDAVRFALTSEAGLNDGLAFPFTNLAILVALEGVAPAGWLAEFVFVEVIYKIGMGLAAGVAVGRLLGWLIFSRRSPIPHTRDGMMALGAAFITYAGTEMVGGYGFLAVFVAGVVLRNQERRHEYLGQMHAFADQIERLLSAVVLVLFGGAIASGLLSHLTWQAVVVALLIVLVCRPVAGLVGLIGSGSPPRERAVISFFGIRGVGSFYYLAYATNEVEFIQVEIVWAITALVVLVSVVLHGVTATPAMAYLERNSGGGAQ